MAAHARGGNEDGTRVLPITRLLAVVIIPFLVVAFWILYVLPHDTARLFAWPVQPAMTAMLLGAVYLAGAYFFLRVVTARAWEAVALGFLPVVGFAAVLGIATVLHWDRFTSGHIAFRVWTALYFTTPFLVLGVWWANQRLHSPGPASDDLILSPRSRLVAAVLGAAAVAISLWLFLRPEQLLQVWPWTLTPLTARVVAAVFMLGGAGIGVASDPRWRSARLLVQVEAVMVVLILAAAGRAWGDFDQENPLTWVFVGWLGAVLVSSAILYRQMERRAAGATRSAKQVQRADLEGSEIEVDPPARHREPGARVAE